MKRHSSDNVSAANTASDANTAKEKAAQLQSFQDKLRDASSLDKDAVFWSAWYEHRANFVLAQCEILLKKPKHNPVRAYLWRILGYVLAFTAAVAYLMTFPYNAETANAVDVVSMVTAILLPGTMVMDTLFSLSMGISDYKTSKANLALTEGEMFVYSGNSTAHDTQYRAVAKQNEESGAMEAVIYRSEPADKKFHESSNRIYCAIELSEDIEVAFEQMSMAVDFAEDLQAQSKATRSEQKQEANLAFWKHFNEFKTELKHSKDELVVSAQVEEVKSKKKVNTGVVDALNHHAQTKLKAREIDRKLEESAAHLRQALDMNTTSDEATLPS